MLLNEIKNLSESVDEAAELVDAFDWMIQHKVLDPIVRQQWTAKFAEAQQTGSLEAMDDIVEQLARRVGMYDEAGPDDID